MREVFQSARAQGFGQRGHRRRRQDARARGGRAFVTNAVAILVAAGRGERMGAGRPKAFLTLGGEPLLLQRRARLRGGALGGRASWRWSRRARRSTARASCSPASRKLRAVVAGGERRQDSVLEGLKRAARRLRRRRAGPRRGAAARGGRADRGRGARRARERGGACRCCRWRTPSSACATGACVETRRPHASWRRRRRRRASASRCCARAYEAAFRDGVDADRRGDGGGAARRAGAWPSPGSARNRKITTPDDLAWAEVELRPAAADGRVTERSASAAASTRTGWWPGRPLVLGGVRSRTTAASRATPTATACSTRCATRCSARRGAGDMGAHFPSRDPRWKGAAEPRLPGGGGAHAGERGLRAREPRRDRGRAGARARAAHRRRCATALARALGVGARRASR